MYQYVLYKPICLYVSYINPYVLYKPINFYVSYINPYVLYKPICFYVFYINRYVPMCFRQQVEPGLWQPQVSRVWGQILRHPLRRPRLRGLQGVLPPGSTGRGRPSTQEVLLQQEL